ncbi:nitroreductase [Methanolobus sp. ZRKC2]|uniref:nitroreductase family protein n=1 Tax=Methanolobus sp. ZRKC2 TaxID=3125783 RepID=UPI0032513158
MVGEENEVIRNIKTRKSVRDYVDKQVSEDSINTIIDAGIHAPTGFGSEPWFFVVIQNREMMKRMSDYCKPRLLAQLQDLPNENVSEFRKRLSQEDFDIFYNAPLLVIVLGSNAGFTTDYDCSMCAQNMMLAAHSMGIGSCWVGTACFIQDNEEFMSELGIPYDYKVIAPIVFGYEGKIVERPPRQDPQIVWVH